MRHTYFRSFERITFCTDLFRYAMICMWLDNFECKRDKCKILSNFDLYTVLNNLQNVILFQKVWSLKYAINYIYVFYEN